MNSGPNFGFFSCVCMQCMSVELSLDSVCPCGNMKNFFFVITTQWQQVGSDTLAPNISYIFFKSDKSQVSFCATQSSKKSVCVYDSVNSVCAHICQHAKCICAYFQSAKSLKAFYLKPKCVCGHILNPPKITFIAHLFQQATQCLYAFPSSVRLFLCSMRISVRIFNLLCYLSRRMGVCLFMHGALSVLV